MRSRAARVRESSLEVALEIVMGWGLAKKKAAPDRAALPAAKNKVANIRCDAVQGREPALKKEAGSWQVGPVGCRG